jgi:hypothetical protein
LKKDALMFATLHDISIADLLAMANGTLEDTITDMDFLETLGGLKCFLLPPWVMQAGEGGQLRRVTRLVYTIDGKLDKAKMILLVARRLKQLKEAEKKPPDFGPRFTNFT